MEPTSAPPVITPLSPPPDAETIQRQQQLEKQRQNPKRLISLFWSLARQYWHFAPGGKANLAWVIFLGLIRSGLSVIFSYISRDFWTALQKKDVPMFWRQISLYGIILLTALPILVWYSYARDRLSLRWRQWHTEKTLVDYFSNRNYYEIDQRKTVDNPDQRIADDIDGFTTTSLSLFLTIFMSVSDLGNFSLILISIYPKLFLVLIAYSSIGTAIAVYLGRRMINLNFLRLQKEADFRYSLIRIRENAESIAFYHGEGREKLDTERRFYSAVDVMVDLIVWQRNLAFFTTSYSYLIQILPLTIIAPLYFSGSIELGVVSQSQQAFSHVLNDLSLIVNQFERISAFSAGVDRLGELEEFIYARFAELQDRKGRNHEGKGKGDIFDEDDDDLDDDDDAKGQGQDVSRGDDIDEVLDFNLAMNRDSAIRRFKMVMNKREDEEELLVIEGGSRDAYIETKITPSGTSRIIVENLTLMTPDKHHRVLFENLSFSLEKGQRLLIVGPSGVGKSSSLRALAGLWEKGRGTITRPKLESMFFLPQRPYCTLGSLREQLVYPTSLANATATEKELLEALDIVNLEELPGRMGGLDTERDWSNILSLGEQQRLAFARIVVGQPKLVILDECSSALDIGTEEKLYLHLKNTDIGFISVGHRPTLFKYHDVVLRFGEPGQPFVLEDITEGMNA